MQLGDLIGTRGPAVLRHKDLMFSQRKQGIYRSHIPIIRWKRNSKGKVFRITHNSIDENDAQRILLLPFEPNIEQSARERLKHHLSLQNNNSRLLDYADYIRFEPGIFLWYQTEDTDVNCFLTMVSKMKPEDRAALVPPTSIPHIHYALPRDLARIGILASNLQPGNRFIAPDVSTHTHPNWDWPIAKEVGGPGVRVVINTTTRSLAVMTTRRNNWPAAPTIDDEPQTLENHIKFESIYKNYPHQLTHPMHMEYRLMPGTWTYMHTDEKGVHFRHESDVYVALGHEQVCVSYDKDTAQQHLNRGARLKYSTLYIEPFTAADEPLSSTTYAALIDLACKRLDKLRGLVVDGDSKKRKR